MQVFDIDRLGLVKADAEALIPLFEGTKVDCADTVSEYISESDWRINANANTGYSNAGLINNAAGKIIANYWLDEVYSQEEGQAHRNGDIHIHDLDCLTGYCAGWSLRALLNEGFSGVAGRVSSRPPRHFREALGQMSRLFQALILILHLMSFMTSLITKKSKKLFYNLFIT